LAESWSMRVPPMLIWPAVGGTRLRIARAVVDLPQPDSPTRPSVSPGETENETPSTARTTRWRRFHGGPCQDVKWTARSRTESRPEALGGRLEVWAVEMMVQL
jgi:hypothetical protein